MTVSRERTRFFCCGPQAVLLLTGLLLAVGPSSATSSEPSAHALEPRTAEVSAEEARIFPGLLLGTSFESHEDLSTGPDRFTVFEHGAGVVRLGTVFRTSGDRSVVVRDVAGDGDFPELLGRFEARRTGRVWLHFALLLTETDHEMNAALAGPAGFKHERDGISFWLSLEDGILKHRSDSIPRAILRPQLFVWYHFDVVLDLDRATYDLTVFEEGQSEPVVTLTEQPTASAARRSAVDRFSFIGDRGGDDSEVDYWIDDLVISSEQVATPQEFIAPGRRRLFIERWSALAESPVGHCPPVLFEHDHTPTAEQPEPASRRLLKEGWSAFRAGCSALARDDFEEASLLLAVAVEKTPESDLYRAARILALAEEGRWPETEAELAALGPQFETDPRFPAFIAGLAEALGDPATAEAWVPAWQGLSSSLAADSSQAEVEVELTAVAGFGLLLRQARASEAEELARGRAALLRDSGARAVWLERAGDAAFLAGNSDLADAHYLQALELLPEDAGGGRARLDLKRADVLWAQGDVEGERAVRERYFGRLR